ncbi:MAG: hypothetical protein LBJ31_11915 [Treponema sp.]|jgi:hypothetical protein|nr:hypothetical protein [Treponema sp.]
MKKGIKNETVIVFIIGVTLGVTGAGIYAHIRELGQVGKFNDRIAELDREYADRQRDLEDGLGESQRIIEDARAITGRTAASLERSAGNITEAIALTREIYRQIKDLDNILNSRGSGGGVNNMDDRQMIQMVQTGNFPDFETLARQFPGLGARVLGYLGKQAAIELAGMMEAGTDGVQFRQMSGNRKSRGGRRMVTYSVGKGAKYARVSSFPLNLFEGGRKLRSGGKEPARNIIRGKLKGSFSARMEGLIGEAENLIVDDWFNKASKGGIKAL